MTQALESVAAPEAARRFDVVADAEPGVLPRLLEEFAKLGATPLRVLAERGDGDALRVTIVMDAPDQQHALHLADRLRRVIGVGDVLLSG